jgi:hypothetical protein
MRILGIDPGLNGGLALITEDGIVTETIPTIGAEKGKTILIPALKNWLLEQKIDHAYLESVHAIFGASAGSTFKFGVVLGIIQGILSACGISFEMVDPKVWTREMHRGVVGKLKSKQKSEIAVSRLFPNVDLKESPRCTRIHDGMMDALLIAEYGRRRMTGGLS